MNGLLGEIFRQRPPLWPRSRPGLDFVEIMEFARPAKHAASMQPLATQYWPPNVLPPHARPAGSFKARGAVHKVLSLTPQQLAAGLVTSSTGNHALAVLHACKAAERAVGLPVPLTIYLPSSADPNKVAK
jgi:hypothetical protein